MKAFLKKVGKAISKFLGGTIRFIKPLKPYIREWAEKELIPQLQKEVNAGAIDAQVDEAMKIAILKAIDRL